MKTKAIAILLTLPILMLMFVVPSSTAQAPIKIGIIGPLGLTQGVDMRRGAILAQAQINALGGILGRRILLIPSDEFMGQADGTAETGRLAMEALMAAGCQFVVGGFRTDSVLGAREVAADYQKLYLITGAATNELIDCGKSFCTAGAAPAWYPAATGGLPVTCGAYNYTATGGPYGRGLAISPASAPCGGPGLGAACVGASVRCNNARYKYTFRITPVNSTYLVNAVTGIYFLARAGFLTYAIGELKKIYGTPVKYAAMVEDLIWAAGFQKILSNSTVYGLLPQGLATAYLGPDVKLDICYLVSPTATNLITEMTRIKTGPDGVPGTGDEARLIIHILSNDLVGGAFTNTWKALDVKAIPVGINVYAANPNAWTLTSGAVEYETVLAPTGTRTNITNLSIPFWNAYVARWRSEPTYTAFGAYQAVKMLNTTITRAGSLDKDLVKAQLEAYDELQVTGQFRFTTYHDVYSVSYGSTWTDGYVRPLMVQWQKVLGPRQEVVFPRDKSYSVKWRLPVSMYPYWETDLDRNGQVNALDMGVVAAAYQTTPGSPGWALDADMDSNGLIDIDDADRVAKDWGASVTLPYVPPP